MKEKGLVRKLAPFILGASLALNSCTTAPSRLARPSITQPLTDWQTYYNRLDVRQPTEQERSYLHQYQALSPDERDEYFNNEVTAPMTFISHKNPSEKDIIFIYHVKDAFSEYHETKHVSR